MLSLLARVCWFVDFQPGRQLFVMPAQNVWRGIKKPWQTEGYLLIDMCQKGNQK